MPIFPRVAGGGVVVGEHLAAVAVAERIDPHCPGGIVATHRLAFVSVERWELVVEPVAPRDNPVGPVFTQEPGKDGDSLLPLCGRGGRAGGGNGCLHVVVEYHGVPERQTFLGGRLVPIHRPLEYDKGFHPRPVLPLALWALPLYRCGAPRNATGYGRGEGGVHFFILSVVFISLFPLCPVVLRGGREIGETPQKW